ncbi:Phenol 2-monooxygenase [Cytospora mali]|uniref:Phenol 2-monooxygenase n=1 Tax=Cytospora mali TaxID=578113 RepID=A0A194UPX3_CYTMA|nr:Phenol 2-monooxygenase [Valsa mali var. pyri (nom. inval.)]
MFLVGSDGASSMIRKRLGVSFDGVSTDVYWGIMDCVYESDYPYAWILGMEEQVDVHSNTPDEVLEQANNIFAPYKLKFAAPLSWFATDTAAYPSGLSHCHLAITARLAHESGPVSQVQSF